MSMIVEKVSVDRVKAKLAMLSQKKKGGSGPSLPFSAAPSRPKVEEFGSNEDEEDEYQLGIQPSKRQKTSTESEIVKKSVQNEQH